MEQTLQREELIKSYLLGELPEQDQKDVEIRLLNDPEYFDEVVMVEDELADDFVFGILPEDQAQRVRRRFLAVPERHEKVKFLKTIEHYISVLSSDETDDRSWERALIEADNNRELLKSLMAEDWAGLHVLLKLQFATIEPHEVASSSVGGILRELIRTGLVETDNGRLYCTQLGVESLKRMERSSGVEFN